MNLKPRQQTALWLIVSVALLSSLIPGGPIENRDFSHIHPGILGAFNIFLTTLDFGSLVLAYFAFRGREWALRLAFVAAFGFFTVYAIDLAQIFPRSPTPMSFALALVEVLGMTAAVPLMFSARRSVAESSSTSVRTPNKRARLGAAAVLVVAGISVVWFATDAAMSGSSSDDSSTTVTTSAFDAN